jgi:hypothetical protein
MKKAIFNVSALSTLLVPAVAFAQNFNYINSFVGQGLIYLRLAVTVLTILMTVYFLYNVLRFIMNTDATKVADLRKAMINGLIGLFVATAVWGIIRLAGSVTGVDTMSGSPAVTCPPGLNYNPAAGTCGTLGI